MKKPLIGISGSHLVDGSGPFAMYPRSYVNHDYVRSIIDAGGIPVILPFTEEEEVVKTLASQIDGLLLSGGHDVSPLFYGEEPLQGLGDIWPERDQFDFTLLETAEERGIPVMGICRGHQIINVFHGGTLYQDLRYDKNCTLKHAQNQRPDLPTHSVDIEADSHYARIIGGTESRVNSFHHQTVKEVGECLRVTARAKDGTIEALESTEYPYLVTYQFHPEMMSATNTDAAALFTDFVAAAKGDHV